jgi:phenylalanine ammonia-lyase
VIGQVGSFETFLHDTARPHPGQVKVGENVRDLLNGSKLAIHEEGEVAIQDDVGILRQDRYALRTSPQWIGPQLETLQLARSQIEVELNSTTDNPLIDVEGGKM